MTIAHDRVWLGHHFGASFLRFPTVNVQNFWSDSGTFQKFNLWQLSTNSLPEKSSPFSKKVFKKGDPLSGASFLLFPPANVQNFWLVLGCFSGGRTAGMLCQQWWNVNVHKTHMPSRLFLQKSGTNEQTTTHFFWAIRVFLSIVHTWLLPLHNNVPAGQLDYTFTKVKSRRDRYSFETI